MHKPEYHKITISLPSKCDRCEKNFQTSDVKFGSYSKEQIKDIKMEFVGKAMLYQKEHRKACIKNHTQTRKVLIEKNAIKKNKT